MADRADVVPLRPRGAPEFSEPADQFVDVADPGRILSVSWSSDYEAVRLSIEAPTGPDGEFVLSAHDVLHLVRTVVAGLPAPEERCSPAPAPVVPLRPRPSQECTEGP